VTGAIDLSQAEMDTIRHILRTYLPAGTRAWVFGSRATASARRFSDLDLALEWERPLGLDVLGAVTEALSESDLPYNVDIVDLGSVDAGFRALIKPDMVAVSF
jgi:predicted nucleotidyltransferase